MAKKKQFIDDEDFELEGFDPNAAAGKLTTDISGGKRPINEYMEVPCNQIIPYQQKKDSDFRQYPEDKFQLLVDSVRDVGVIEAITLRALPDGRFECLVGEHRWKASIAAGKETVPAHVITNLSDAQAEEYFSITNILRRDTTMLDRVNGWWHIYHGNGDSLKLGGTEDLIDLAYELSPSDKKPGYTKRHIYRYIKMHDLLQPLKERLDAPFPKTLTLMAGYWLAFLPAEMQQAVIDLDKSVSEEKAKKIKDAYEDGSLTNEMIKDILTPVKQKESDSINFRSLNKQIKKIALEQIKPEYLAKTGKIFSAAMKEYLEKHPEYKNESPEQSTQETADPQE